MRWSFGAALWGLILAAIPPALVADTIVFRSGGKMQARVLEEDSTETTLVLQRGKGRISVPRAEVAQVLPDRDPSPDYQKLKAKTPDTADGQYALAKWCDEHNLPDQARAALHRALKLDPNHVLTRKRLGYLREGDHWISRAEYMKARGFQQVEGRWVSRQEKSMLTKAHVAEEAERRWYKDVRLWKNWLVGRDPSRARQAEDLLRRITDPLAIKPLDKVLGMAPEAPVRLLLVQILAQIPSSQATRSLVRRAIYDRSDSVRAAAAEQLRDRTDRAAALQKLIGGLKSSDNRVVRRCAEALDILGDPSAVPSLINALVTTHQVDVLRPDSNGAAFGTIRPGIIDYQPVVGSRGAVGFTPTVAPQFSGFGMGNGVIRQRVTVDVQNPEVLAALENLTGESLGYNPALWRQWVAQEYRKQEVLHKSALPEP